MCSAFCSDHNRIRLFLHDVDILDANLCRFWEERAKILYLDLASSSLDGKSDIMKTGQLFLSRSYSLLHIYYFWYMAAKQKTKEGTKQETSCFKKEKEILVLFGYIALFGFTISELLIFFDSPNEIIKIGIARMLLCGLGR